MVTVQGHLLYSAVNVFEANPSLATLMLANVITELRIYESAPVCLFYCAPFVPIPSLIKLLLHHEGHPELLHRRWDIVRELFCESPFVKFA